MRSPATLAVRLLVLNAGLFVLALGIALTLRAHLGLTPWDVLHQGVSRHTPLTIGEASQVVGLVVVGLSTLLGVRPGVGTVLNMALVGFWLDRVLQWGWIPDVGTAPVAVRVAMLAAGIGLAGAGSGAYIGPRLGAGPRDSFMLAATARTGRPLALVRGVIELLVCAAGWALGGTVGVGTILSAVSLGPAMHLGLRVARVDTRRPAGPTAVPVAVLEEPLASGA